MKAVDIIAGPCAIESREHSMRMAEMIGRVCDKLGVRWIFKACYDKDCRSSPSSFHGLGLDDGLQILTDVRAAHGVPVTSDFSDPSWGPATGPLFGRRQTRLRRPLARSLLAVPPNTTSAKRSHRTYRLSLGGDSDA